MRLDKYLKVSRLIKRRTVEEPDWLVELREKLNGKIRALEDGFR